MEANKSNDQFKENNHTNDLNSNGLSKVISLQTFYSNLFLFYDLFALPLTNDETSALMRLNAKSVSELLGTVVWNDGHPMLVQVFLWYWTKWFGAAVWVVKLPFLLCGLGSVILMIRIGIRLAGPHPILH
jgi:hypothetical protein